ncbi:hypothetical protein DAI22_12g036000 [Oryza sativa Japonica Group]|nr:hypothetical protein DAI22_12g036000 [Oryza sativa Japonica Group]
MYMLQMHNPNTTKAQTGKQWISHNREYQGVSTDRSHGQRSNPSRPNENLTGGRWQSSWAVFVRTCGFWIGYDTAVRPIEGFIHSSSRD